MAINPETNYIILKIKQQLEKSEMTVGTPDDQRKIHKDRGRNENIILVNGY